MALAALLYIHRVSLTTSVSIVTPDYINEGRLHTLQDKDLPEYVTIIRIHGPFLFGTTDKLIEETEDLETFGSIVVLRLRNMTVIDATGMHELERFSDRLKKSGRQLLICGARSQPARFLKQAEFIDHVGANNILPHFQAAIQRARQLHEERGVAATNGLERKGDRL
jgi:SulP family sulfate permease